MKWQVWVEETIGYSGDMTTTSYQYDNEEYPDEWSAQAAADRYHETYDTETTGGYPRGCYFYIINVEN